jgi:hypothetical protein
VDPWNQRERKNNMAFTWPYKTAKFTAYEGDKRITNLSQALSLVDDYTKEEPIGYIKVGMKEDNIEAFRNPSGYYIFTDLGSGIFTLNIESDIYFPIESTIDTTRINITRINDVTLEFDSSGPVKDDTSTILKDASKLEIGDNIEFYNSSGDIEQRKITQIENSKTIFWIEKLKKDYNGKVSRARLLKYLIDEILMIPLPSYPFPGHATLVRGFICDSGNNPINGAIVQVKGLVETKTDKNGEFVLYFKKPNGPIEIEINGVAQPDKVILENLKTVNLGKIII